MNMEKGTIKVTTCIVISLIMIAGFSIMFESTAEGPEGYEAEGEDDIYTTFVEKDAVEEEEPTSYNLTEGELEEIEELMVEALGLEDGPKLESEIDLMEWFAEMDEDDWSDLTEYTSETDDDTGCGSAGYDGRDGPRERGEEELMSPPPMQPNGGGTYEPGTTL
ncbi:MAG: hypothetical protein R6W73_03990 [Candidatus Saliniplasma sp.]